MNTKSTSKNAVKEIPWEEAKAFAEKNGQDFAIIVCGNAHLTHVVTWGRTPCLSAISAQRGNWLKDRLWPDSSPHEDLPKWLGDLMEACRSASCALRSYQYGNSATDFARDVADNADEALAQVTAKLNSIKSL